MNMDPFEPVISSPCLHSGASFKEPGVKHDQGKPRAWVMMQDFPAALTAVSKVSTFGIEKYSVHSWRTVPNAKQRNAKLVAALRGIRDLDDDPDPTAEDCANLADASLARAESATPKGGAE